MAEELYSMVRLDKAKGKPWRLDCYRKSVYGYNKVDYFYYKTRWGAKFMSFFKWQNGKWLYERLVLIDVRTEAE